MAQPREAFRPVVALGRACKVRALRGSIHGVTLALLPLPILLVCGSVSVFRVQQGPIMFNIVHIEQNDLVVVEGSVVRLVLATGVDSH